MPLLSVSDVFLLPSAQESFGLAALEAMACEVPVIASRVGGLPEVIEDGVSGFLHPPDDLEAMAASTVRVLSDADLHARIADAACRRVRTEFCVERVVPMYERCNEESIPPGLVLPRAAYVNGTSFLNVASIHRYPSGSVTVATRSPHGLSSASLTPAPASRARVDIRSTSST